MRNAVNLNSAINEIEQLGLREWLISEFTAAFREARKNKTHTFNEHAYDERWPENIIRLVDAILENYYKPSPSISFIIFDPMVREIFAAPFVDRIVHHFLYKMQAEWWDNRFITDSYSCREGKGNIYGVKRVHRMMRRASCNFTKPALFIKLDIRGYFMSLPRIRLFRLIKWGLGRQFAPYMNRPAGYELYKICLYLWYQTLMDDPVKHSHRRGPRHHWAKLPPEKSLYCQPWGLGIVIGNLTSQLVSNIYLDQLDRFVKYTLGIKYYGRYVDDFVIILPGNDYALARRLVKQIERYLKDELELTLHPKKRYFGPVTKGISFLGFRIYPHCLYPSNRLQKKLIHALRQYKKTGQGKDSLISIFGLLSHMNGDKYVKKLFDEYGYDYSLYLEIKSPNRRKVPEIIDDMGKTFEESQKS